MMQMGLIHCRRFSICFPCSLIWFVCVFFFSHFLFYLRLLGFSYCLTWHLFLSNAYQTHLTASCIASLFSFPFCYFQRACPLPILPSPTYFLCTTLTFCTSSLGILKVQSFFFFFFFFVCIAIVLQRPGQSKFSVPLTLSHWRHCLKTAMWVSNMSCEDSWMYCLTELMAHSWLTSCASLLWRVSWTLPHVNDQ